MRKHLYHLPWEVGQSVSNTVSREGYGVMVSAGAIVLDRVMSLSCGSLGLSAEGRKGPSQEA